MTPRQRQVEGGSPRPDDQSDGRKVHWQEVDDWTRLVIALRHCEFWLAAVEGQVRRLAEQLHDPGAWDYFPRRTQKEIDLHLFLVVVRRYDRAANMIVNLLEDPALTAAYHAMHDDELVDLRDMTEHFDDYVQGRGTKQPTDDRHGFLALVEFKDPVMAYGHRSVKLSRTHLAVQAFHRELLAALDRP